MTHDDIRHRLSDYIDDAVTQEERVEIEQHLKGCEACSAALEELTRTIETMKMLDEVEPPAWMTGKIMARVREDAERQKGLFHRLFFPLSVKVPLQAVAMLFLAVTAFSIYQTIRPEMKYAGSPPAELQTEQAAPAPSMEQAGRMAKAPVPSAAAPQKDGAGPQTPGYRSLDMKYSYEKPAAPEPLAEPMRRQAEAEGDAASSGKEERAAGAPAPARAKALSDRISPSAREVARSAAISTPVEPVRISLVVQDLVTSAEKIKEAVIARSGKVVKDEITENARTMHVQITQTKHDDLLRALRKLGDMQEPSAAPSAAEAMVTIRITLTRSPHSPR